MFSTKTHVHDLHGWTGHIKLQYVIFLHYIAYCLGMVPCVSFVYDLLEQSSGCVYVAQNNGHAPSIQYSRWKWQDVSVFISLFYSLRTTTPQHVCTRKPASKRDWLVECQQTRVWTCEDCLHFNIWGNGLNVVAGLLLTNTQWFPFIFVMTSYVIGTM
jgi:hypothetical protein